jgi:hypothetical protein
MSNIIFYYLFTVLILWIGNVQSFSVGKNSPRFHKRHLVVQGHGCILRQYSCCCGASTTSKTPNASSRSMANYEDDGVVELVEEETDNRKTRDLKGNSSTRSVSTAPFLSQGEISEEALNPDFTDPKQTRVIIYIVLSLLPVLFLIPLMLGSRDLIPLDALPPVQM